MKSDYKTKQKAALLDLFTENGSRHITAAEIVEKLSENGTKIGTATVYRHLDKLVSDGFLKKYITDSGACYQYGGDCDGNHFHLKCTVCGTLFHVDCDFLESLSPHILEHHKFKVDNTRTVMYGTCEKCSQ